MPRGYLLSYSKPLPCGGRDLSRNRSRYVLRRQWGCHHRSQKECPAKKQAEGARFNTTTAIRKSTNYGKNKLQSMEFANTLVVLLPTHRSSQPSASGTAGPRLPERRLDLRQQVKPDVSIRKEKKWQGYRENAQRQKSSRTRL